MDTYQIKLLRIQKINIINAIKSNWMPIIDNAIESGNGSHYKAFSYISASRSVYFIKRVISVVTQEVV